MIYFCQSFKPISYFGHSTFWSFSLCVRSVSTVFIVYHNNPFLSFSSNCIFSETKQQGHTLLARHSGADASLLHSLLTQHASASAPLSTSSAQPQAPAAAQRPRTEAEIVARCHELMNKHKVVLFMKGNPTAPKCGFSRQTVGLLREQGVEFAWFDIFSDEDVRQGLKKVNDWPSESNFPIFPQPPTSHIFICIWLILERVS